MERSIPILVSKKDSIYTAQVLFSPNIQVCDKSEWKARRKLEKYVQGRIERIVKNNNTAALSQFLFAPLCKIKNFHLRTEFRSLSINIWLPIVYWSEGENHYLLCPFLDQFCYIHNDAELSTQTVENFFQFWMQKENYDAPKVNSSQMIAILKENFSENHTYSIRMINVVFYEKLDFRWYSHGVNIKFKAKSSQKTAKSALSKKVKKELIKKREKLIKNALSDQKNEVDEYDYFEEPCKELKVVGESIDYNPNSYEEQFFLDDFVFVNPPANETLCNFYERLYFALTDKNHRKGVLIVGSELSGRAYAIETVLQTIQRNVNYKLNENNLLVNRNNSHYYKVWKLSGSGIISGMSAVGKWEARAEEIFSFAERNDLILYFESLLGLTEAGAHDMTTLSVADALLTYMKEKKIRVISKITPTQLVKLRERNRSFVNQFEILTMPSLSQEELQRIYISKVQDWRKYDQETRSPFDHIPFLSQLVEWTNPDSGAPGSVCKWLDKISSRPSSNVQDRLLSQVGANFPLLKNEPSPNYEEIHKDLSDQVIGQEEAIDALTNWTLKFQGLMSDPGRPAATMLFLGPTGVGKTESAKAVARFLYKDDSHFLRFDCNELDSAYAVSHLIGSARHEGTLTNAVRMEPFSVVLFDEIEKAHPVFHDLLLQILGEGRLTDGKGRTTSFKNCFIILTSNLGANQTGRFTGFGDIYQNDRDIYFKAVEHYFRPEFVNRLDKVVPFNRLGYSELELIAKRYIDQIRSREGFQKRKALLSISPTALDWLVQQGHDPKYGARQTQRCLERILVEPLSAFFAQTSWNTISVIDVGCENNKLTYSVSQLASSPSKPKDSQIPGKFYENGEPPCSDTELVSSSLKPKGTHLSKSMFDEITYDQFKVFYNAFTEWKNRIESLFPAVSSDESSQDWNNMDDVSLLRFKIQEELNDIDKEDFNPETYSYGISRCYDPDHRDLDKVYQKLNSYIFLDEVRRGFSRPGKGWRYRDFKIPVIKRLSPQDWELLMDSESGFYPDSTNLTEVEYVNMPYCRALSRCCKLNQFFASGFPQQEEALILIFSTGKLENEEQIDASDKLDSPRSDGLTSADREVPVINHIVGFADSGFAPVHLNKVLYNSPRLGKMFYLHARGLGAYQTLTQKISGVYVMFDEFGRLSRADSVVVLPFDSKQQTASECIEKYLESKQNVWTEIRYMYMNGSFYESEEVDDYYDLPPEFEQALSEIIPDFGKRSEE